MSENNKHGGARANAGRKSKALEDKVQALSIQGLIAVFGSEEQAFESIAKEAKAGSFTHLKLLVEYAYGKPTEKVNVDMPDGINLILKKHDSGH